MPIAHTCPSCGLSLTMVPAALDPVYRLPVVVCPGCGTAGVRCSDGRRVVPRTLARLRTATTAAMANTLWTLIGAIVCAATSVGMANSLRSSGMTARSCLGMLVGLTPRDDGFLEFMDEGGAISLLTWAGVNVFIGAFLTGALPHLRRCVFVTLFVALVIVLSFVPDTIGLIVYVSRGQVEEARADRLGTRYGEVVAGLRLLPAAALPALAGIPLGQRLSRSAARVRAGARRRLLARARRRRQSP